VHVYRARWVIPVSRPPIEDGAVAVEGGRIAWVGPAADAPAGEARDLGDAVLTPGLVNAHCHLELTAMRGFLEDLAFQQWIAKLTRSRRDVLRESDFLLDSARYGIVEGLHAGITTYADTCESGVALRAMRDMGVRGVMYQEVFGPDPALAEGAMAGLREQVERHRAEETPLVRVGVSPHAPYSVSDALFIDTASYAMREELPIAIHLAESEDESRYVRDADGPFAEMQRARGIRVAPRAASPVQLLADLGVLAARPLLIHVVRATEGELRLIGAAGCSVAHCPASNAKLGHGIAPLAEMLRLRLAVGLGSDSVASNNRMHILEEARLAVLFQRARLGLVDSPTAAQALHLATLGGARALGLHERIGSLDAGKEADLAAFPVAFGCGVPTHDPVATAVFSLGSALASFVAVAGEPRVVDGRLVTRAAALEGDALAARVCRAAELLQDWERARLLATPA
jgi:cytosine/adenosine deaminase-related metal-dependent hydrolase